MFFFSLALFLCVTWFFPWWVGALCALALGWWLTPGKRATIHLCAGAGLAWAALAFIQDGRNYGLVSRRVSGLFNLPHSSLVFLLMALLAMITVWLCLESGSALRALFTDTTKKAKPASRDETEARVPARLSGTGPGST